MKINKNSFKERRDELWFKEASPFLVQKALRRKERKQAGISLPVFRLTKRQIRAKKRAERAAKKLGNKKAKKVSNVMPKYEVYINSIAWKIRRNEFYKRYGRKCFACGSTTRLTVHHMAYTHMGNELDEELSVLCWACHKEFHELNGTHRDMIFATTSFIEEKRQHVQFPVLR